MALRLPALKMGIPSWYLRHLLNPAGSFFQDTYVPLAQHPSNKVKNLFHKSNFGPLFHEPQRPETCLRVANHIVTSPNDIIVLPFSSFPSTLTESILSKDFRSLTINKDSVLDKRKLEEYTKAYKHKSISTYSDVPEKMNLPLPQNNYYAELDENSGETKINVFVPLLSKRVDNGFYTHLCDKISEIHPYINPKLCFTCIVSNRLDNYLDSQPSTNLRHYRAITVLINTLFYKESLESLNLSEDFAANIQPKTFNLGKDERVQLIRLVFKNGVPDFIFENFTAYKFFVKQSLSKSTSPISTFVNKWFNITSLDLHRLGFRHNLRCGDLSVTDFVRLFKYILFRKDYKDSIFDHAAEGMNDPRKKSYID